MRDEVSHLHDRTARLVIGLYTDDFSMIHDLTREFSMRNVTLVHYAEGDVVGDELDALIIRKGVPLPTFKGGKSTVVNMMRDPLATVDRALTAGMGRYRPGRLTIGVDPGARPGVAFIADGLLIKAESASDTSEVRSIIRRAVRAIGPERSMIRIGRGDPANRDSIIDVLGGIGIPIEIVDERRTTRGTKYRDQNAAVRIARESGDPDSSNNFKNG